MNLADLSIDWWIEDTLARIPQKQREMADEATNGIPHFLHPITKGTKDDFGNPIPSGTGPHSYRSFEIWSKVIPEPKRILEIGFNLGHGAAVLLSLFPNSEIVSVDIRDSSELKVNAGNLASRYPGRHSLIIGDSKKADSLLTGSFEAAFIDGAHDLPSIMADIECCRRLGVTRFLMDDVHPRYGDTLEAIRMSGLQLNAIVGANMAICEDIT